MKKLSKGQSQLSVPRRGSSELTFRGRLKGEVIPGIDLKGIDERRRRCLRSVERSHTAGGHYHAQSRPGVLAAIVRLRTKVHCLCLRDLDFGTLLGAAPPGTNDAVVGLPDLELCLPSVGAAFACLINICPNITAGDPRNLRLLAYQVVVLGAARVVSDNDGVFVDHFCCCLAE